MKFERKEKYILITGEGVRNDLLAVVEATNKMYSIIKETESRLVLADYRNVTFNLHQTEAFNVIRFYESKLPLLKDIVVAVVLGEESLAIGRLWNDIGKSRGYDFEIFTDFEEAENWLLSK